MNDADLRPGSSNNFHHHFIHKAMLKSQRFMISQTPKLLALANLLPIYQGKTFPTNTSFASKELSFQ